MHLMIFYPGGVSYGVPLSEEPTNEELYDMLYTAATVEQGNGKPNRKEHKRENKDNSY